MTVAEYAKSINYYGDEITCVDTVYDVEWYAYVEEEDYDDEDDDDFFKACKMIWENLEINEVINSSTPVVVIDMTGIVEKYLDEIKKANLFVRNTVEDIVMSMNEIFSGYVSEDWMMKFAKIITGRNDRWLI